MTELALYTGAETVPAAGSLARAATLRETDTPAGPRGGPMTEFVSRPGDHPADWRAPSRDR